MQDELAAALAAHEAAEALLRAGDLAGAEVNARQALALWQEQEGSDSPDTANLLVALGRVLDAAGRYEETETVARRAVILVEKLVKQGPLPELEILLVRALQQLGNALREQGLVDEAEPPLRRALKLSYGHPGEPGLIASAANNLGILCKQTERYGEAEEFYRRALKLWEGHPEAGADAAIVIYANLGSLAEAMGQQDVAEVWFGKAVEAKRSAGLSS